MITDYFNEINTIIANFLPVIKNYTKEEKIYSINKGFIRGEIIFKRCYILSFMEFKDVEKTTKSKYSYHFMSRTNDLIFRYDNCSHHPEILTFPHHKHLPETIEETNEPELLDILLEIYKRIKL